MPLHMTWTITGTVDDIYRPGAITAAADDSLEQIASRLQDKDISALVIMAGYRLVGIITERDIVRAVADRRNLADGTAGESMTSAPATVALQTPLAEVARRMLAYGVRHLPVRSGRRGDRHGIGQGSARAGERHDPDTSRQEAERVTRRSGCMRANPLSIAARRILVNSRRSRRASSSKSPRSGPSCGRDAGC